MSTFFASAIFVYIARRARARAREYDFDFHFFLEQAKGEKEVAGLVSQAEGKASEPQSGVESLPTLPHFITTALGQVSLSVDSDPRGLAEVVVVPVSQGFRPIGRMACRLLLETNEEYQSWVRGMQQLPNLGTLKWAKGHGYPFEILLAVVGENNRGTKQSLVYQVCLRALVEGGLKGAKSIAICSLGPPTKETGRKTVRAMREFLETLEPSLDGEPYHREPRNPRLIFNAATPREMAGANRALEKWRSDLLLTFAKRNPFSILENGLNLLHTRQKGVKNGS